MHEDDGAALAAADEFARLVPIAPSPGGNGARTYLIEQVILRSCARAWLHGTIA